MKWFKHMTCSGDDEKLAAIIDELGMEGYGFYWRLLEIVAEKLDATGNTACQFSPKKWGNFFQFSAKKFLKFSEILAKKRLIFVEISENFVKIDIPNLLKYKDNYQKNLQVADKKVSPILKKRDKEEEFKEDKSSFSAEQPVVAHAQEVEQVVEKIPLVDGTEFSITETHLAEFEKAYPAVDVLGTLLRIRAWCISNPKKRKTKNGCLRFVNSWLEKEQNRGGGLLSTPSHVPKATSYAQQLRFEQDQQAKALLAASQRRQDNAQLSGNGGTDNAPQLALPPEWGAV